LKNKTGDVMKTVRWGLLSTANINQALIPAIRQSKRGELTAVSSRSLEPARDYADKWNIPHAFGSYTEMLESGEIDAVYIALPNHLHAEWSIKALENNLGVLCEKPFAISLLEVDAMIKASQENSTPITEAFMYRHHPQTKLVGRLVNEGLIGEINLIRGAFHFLLPSYQRRPDSMNVRMIPDYGGGCLWDVGVYPVSYFQYLLNQAPNWVFGSQQLGDTGVDEVFMGQMGYRTSHNQEVIAQFSSSFNDPFHTLIEIIGTKGKLQLTRPFTNIDRSAKVIYTNLHGKSKNIRFPRKPLYLGEVEDLQSAIIENKPTVISLQESRNHIQTVLALLESAQSGRAVNL
jgi:predicted dehydrogenase